MPPAAPPQFCSPSGWRIPLQAEPRAPGLGVGDRRAGGYRTGGRVGVRWATDTGSGPGRSPLSLSLEAAGRESSPAP